MKKIYKSNENKIFSGVIGSIGEYLDIDPTILRLVYILVAIMTGVFPAIIGYIVASLVIPKRLHIPHTEHTEKTETKSV